MNNLKFLLAGAIFWIVAYGIGVAKHYKTEKEWLIPNTRYWKNIFKSGSIWLNSILGIMAPNHKRIRTDGDYYKPSRSEFDMALYSIHEMMKSQGWTVSAYKKDSKDCDDYATKMAVEIRNYITMNFPKSVGLKGVAVGIIGYKKDINGKGHALVKAYIGNEVEYYEPYPGTQYLKSKKLSRKELDSIMLDIV